MNLFYVNEPVYDLCRYIYKIVGLVVVSSSTKVVIVMVSGAYQSITSAQIYHSALCWAS